MKDKLPSLIRSDAYILAAITRQPGSEPQKLQEFANDYDYLYRGFPTFDQLSYGLVRLIAHGYVAVEQVPGKVMRLQAMEPALQIRSEVGQSAKTLGNVLSGFASALGCLPYPTRESEDRSLGPLPNFDPLEWKNAVAGYDRWFFDTLESMSGIKRQPDGETG